MNFFYKINLLTNLIKYRGLLIKKQYSKNSEDKFLIKFFRNKLTGTYVDIGAFHPYRFSNTYLLYNQGWNGLNIDINKKSIDLFKIARPNDVNLNVAVGDRNKKQIFYYKKKLYPMNTLNKDFAKRYIDKNIKKNQIMTYTFDFIIKKFYNQKKFDLLDIDVEGNEYNVIKKINFNKVKFSLILIEITNFNTKSKENARKIRNLLAKYGYKYIKSFGETSVYKNISYKYNEKEKS